MSLVSFIGPITPQICGHLFLNQNSKVTPQFVWNEGNNDNNISMLRHKGDFWGQIPTQKEFISKQTTESQPERERVFPQ
jgi:hypothetical protein